MISIHGEAKVGRFMHDSLSLIVAKANITLSVGVVPRRFFFYLFLELRRGSPYLFGSNYTVDVLVFICFFFLAKKMLSLFLLLDRGFLHFLLYL